MAFKKNSGACAVAAAAADATTLGPCQVRTFAAHNVGWSHEPLFWLVLLYVQVRHAARPSAAVHSVHGTDAIVTTCVNFAVRSSLTRSQVLSSFGTLLGLARKSEVATRLLSSWPR